MASKPTDAEVEAVGLAAWLAYCGFTPSRPTPAYEGDEEPEDWDQAVRNWHEWPSGCTHIGADGFRDCARAAIIALDEVRNR